MQLFISRYVSINNSSISLNGKKAIVSDNRLSPEEVYRQLQINYPKFFKMDILCKWAVIAGECLMNNAIYNGDTETGFVYEGYAKEKIALMLMTGNGCLDVDNKYQHSMESIASPALFVYTLPNIMLGEICIKHGFKGEQLCLVSDGPNATEMQFWVSDILQNRDMDACLCGWVDAVEGNQSIHMLWIDKKGGYGFSPENLKAIFAAV